MMKSGTSEGQKAKTTTTNGGSAELDKKPNSQYLEGLEARFVQRCEMLQAQAQYKILLEIFIEELMGLIRAGRKVSIAWLCKGHPCTISLFLENK
ncbi:unnamed protein product [Calypogeia fissa]